MFTLPRFGRLLLLTTVVLSAGTSAEGQIQASPEQYRTHALQAEADATRGRELFADAGRTLCATCHTIDGTGSKVGPDLSGIGDKLQKDALIRAILEPSAEIAVGYSNTLFTTTTGEIISGVVKQADANFIELMSADSQRHRMARGDLKEQSAEPESLMPQGLQSALSVQEFADLVAFLGSLHQSGGETALDIPLARRAVEFRTFFPEGFRLDHPVWFASMPGRADRFVALEHFGRVVCIQRKGDAVESSTILDLRGVVRPGGASGLLGMAFHPKFQENRKYYLQYQIEERGRISTLLVGRRFGADFTSDSGEPARELLRIPSTTQDHQGGCIEFGPDGFLYMGMGDTGPQEDPQGHGQDMGTLLGKMLRIDVDRAEAGLEYAIPAGNPFVGKAGVRPEIWAAGFREPWRFTFDRETADLWVGDVGQNRWEEVGIVRSGENHGWNVFEGDRPFSERYRKTGEAYVPPVFTYSHRLGVSVTGGYVYRGKSAPKMGGWYVFADYETRRLWALRQKDRRLERIVEIGQVPSRAVSFAQMPDGELCVVGYDSGVIYQIGLDAADPTPLRKRMIAETSEGSPVQWRYTLTRPIDGWTSVEFQDAEWSVAPGGFGTRGTPGAVVRTEWAGADIWLRRTFDLPAGPSLAGRKFAVRIHHDEDTEVYLNGSRIAALSRWTTGYTEVPLTPEQASALKTGANTLAVHCHQNGGGQYIDVGLIEYSAADAD